LPLIHFGWHRPISGAGVAECAEDLAIGGGAEVVFSEHSKRWGGYRFGPGLELGDKGAMHLAGASSWVGGCADARVPSEQLVEQQQPRGRVVEDVAYATQPVRSPVAHVCLLLWRGSGGGWLAVEDGVVKEELVEELVALHFLSGLSS